MMTHVPAKAADVNGYPTGAETAVDGEADVTADGEMRRAPVGGKLVEMDIAKIAKPKGGAGEAAAGVTIDDVVRSILSLDDAGRDEVATMLLGAKEYTMTSADIRNLRLVSNVTVDELFDYYSLNRGAFNISLNGLESGYTILNTPKMSVKGDDYSGLFFVGDGERPVVVIKDKADAVKFLRYLEARSALEDVREKGGFSKEVVDGLDRGLLDAIAEKRYGKGSTVGLEMMLSDFLDYSGKFEDVMYDGKWRNSVRVLDDVMRKVTGSYHLSRLRSFGEAEMAAWQTVRDKTDPNYWTVPKVRFYEALARYTDIADRVSKQEFVLYNRDQLYDLLLKPETGLFARYGMTTLSDMSVDMLTMPKVEKGQLEEYGTGRVPLTEYVEENWAEVSSALKPGAEKKAAERLSQDWGSYSEIGADERAKLFNENVVYSYTDEDGNEHPVRAEAYTRKTGSVEKRYVRYYYEYSKMRVRGERIGPSTISFKRTGWTAESKLGMSYDSKRVPGVINGESDGAGGVVNGSRYHGAYVYSDRTEDGRTVYYISRDVFSRAGHIRPYRTLEDALEGIDSMNGRSRAEERAMVSVKQMTGKMREAVLDGFGLERRQVLSVLDYSLPEVRYRSIHRPYRRLFKYTVNGLHRIFDEELGTQGLYTPEMWSAYLMEQYNDIYNVKGWLKPQNASGIVDQIKENHLSEQSRWDGIVDAISNADMRHYYLEDLYSNNRTGYNKAKLVELENNGVRLDPSGAKVGSKPVGKFISQTLDMAVRRFRRDYGDIVRTVGREELKSERFRDLGLADRAETVKAFVHDGLIYIVTPNADARDLYHEMTHVLLGVVKNNSFDEYTAILDHFSEMPEFKRLLVNVREEYPTMADSDVREETLARHLANSLFRNADLTVIDRETVDGAGETVREIVNRAGFDGKVWAREMKYVLDVLRGQMERWSEGVEKGQDIGFNGWLKAEIGKGSGASMTNDRVVTNMIRQMIYEGKITEIC